MKIKTCLAVIATALLPTWVLAQDCSKPDSISAANCAEGQVWDPATSSCLLQSTS